MRVQNHPGFVLHARDYSETSLLLEVFTRQHGRLGLLAKGARRPSSRVRGLLKPFQPLVMSWSGRGELPVLTGAEADGAEYLSSGAALYCGFYVNELLMRLLHRHDAHERLYDVYRQTLARLADVQQTEAALRIFEKCLLSDIGYGLVLDHDVGDGAPIDPEAWYDYVPEHGPVRLANPEVARPQGIAVRGSCLIALANDTLIEPATLREAKRLMRMALARHLGDKPLHSRKLFQASAVRTTAAEVAG